MLDPLVPYRIQVRAHPTQFPIVTTAAQEAFAPLGIELAPAAVGAELVFKDAWSVINAEGVLGLERRLRGGFARLARLAPEGVRVMLIQGWSGLVVDQLDAAAPG